MKKVFSLYHEREYKDGHSHVKLIGLYSSRTNANAALGRVRAKFGFRDHPHGFSIHVEMIDPPIDGWSEGFVKALL